MNTEQKPSNRVRAVIDTNVIVSGFNFPGNERQILNLGHEGKIEGIFLALFWRRWRESCKGSLAGLRLRIDPTTYHRARRERRKILENLWVLCALCGNRIDTEQGPAPLGKQAQFYD